MRAYTVLTGCTATRRPNPTETPYTDRGGDRERAQTHGVRIEIGALGVVRIIAHGNLFADLDRVVRQALRSYNAPLIASRGAILHDGAIACRG
jgi:hypothetical protein